MPFRLNHGERLEKKRCKHIVVNIFDIFFSMWMTCDILSVDKKKNKVLHLAENEMQNVHVKSYN